MLDLGDIETFGAKRLVVKYFDVRGQMHRSQWRHVGGYLRSSLWVVPLVAIPLGMITTRILHWLDGQFEWALNGLATTGARALLDAVITSSLSFMVFTFGSLL